MSESTITEHEQEFTRRRDVLTAARADLDQLQAEVESAEQEAEEVPKLGAAARLGEIEQDEADEKKRAIAARLDDARTTLTEAEAEVEEVERRAEEAGDAWAESVTLEPQRAAYKAQQERLRIEAVLAEARRVEEAKLGVLAEARKRAKAIVDETRETSSSTFYRDRRRDEERTRATAAIREAVKWANEAERDRLLAGDYGDEARDRYLDELAEHERIRAYWDERARKQEPPPSAPTPKPVATEGS